MENLAAAEILELVERCKTGDMLGYKQLYQRYAQAMYNTCLRILNNVQEAEDVLQESFTEAFKNLQRFEQRTSFGGWLKQICVNRSINQLKKRRVSFVDIDQTAVHEIAAGQAPDETEIMMKVAAVKNSMMKLPDGYRTAQCVWR